MKPEECLEVSKQMQKDLSKHVVDPTFSPQLISGQGFRHLALSSDMLNCPKILRKDLVPFLQSFMATVDVHGQARQLLANYCEILPDVEKHVWKKYEFLYANPQGKGSWIGVYYRAIDDDTCEFYSNNIKCAFELMPDVYVVRTVDSSSFGPFRTTDTSYNLVERTRGFTKQDLDAIMSVCNGVTQFKAISNG